MARIDWEAFVKAKSDSRKREVAFLPSGSFLLLRGCSRGLEVHLCMLMMLVGARSHTAEEGTISSAEAAG